MVTSVSASTNFSETDNCTDIALNAGGSCEQVSLTPGQTGSITGQLTIDANISGGEIRVHFLAQVRVQDL